MLISYINSTTFLGSHNINDNNLVPTPPATTANNWGRVEENNEWDNSPNNWNPHPKWTFYITSDIILWCIPKGSKQIVKQVPETFCICISITREAWKYQYMLTFKIYHRHNANFQDSSCIRWLMIDTVVLASMLNTQDKSVTPLQQLFKASIPRLI